MNEKQNGYQIKCELHVAGLIIWLFKSFQKDQIWTTYSQGHLILIFRVGALLDKSKMADIQIGVLL